MDLRNCSNELRMVCMCVLAGVGTKFKPFESMDSSGGAILSLVRLTMRLLLV